MSLQVGLISHWKLDETSTGSGAVTRNDSHGSNHLTDNNTVVSATGKLSNGADFEKDNTEYLSITDGSQVGLDLGVSGQDFAVSMWINVESTPTQWLGSGGDTRPLISKWSSVSNQRTVCLEYGYNGSNYIFASHTTSDGSSVTSNVITCGLLTTGAWYHVVAIYDASAGTVEWYLNNSSLGTTGATTSLYNSTSAFQIGALSQQGCYFDGVIDEVSIWGRTISSTEVAELYNSANAKAYPYATLSSDLISYWKLDETSDGSGAVTRNDSYGANHLTDSNTTPSATGKLNNGADFERANSEYLSISDNASLSPTEEVSLSCWVKLESVDASGYNAIVQKGDTFYTGSDARGGAYTMTFYYNAATDWRIRAIVIDSTGTTRDCTTNQNFYSDVGTFIHVVLTWDRYRQMRIYRNASSLSFSSATGAPVNIKDSSEVFVLGGAKYNGSILSQQDGILDEVGLWGRALTQSEVDSLYNSGNAITFETIIGASILYPGNAKVYAPIIS